VLGVGIFSVEQKAARRLSKQAAKIGSSYDGASARQEGLEE